MEDEEKRARQEAMRHLALRNHFSGELKRKLKRKGIGEEAADSALRFCEQKGYLNDSASIERFIQREEKRGYGPQMIAYKLKERGGLPSTEIAKIMRALQKNEENVLRQFLQKHLAKKSQSSKRKIAQQLARRGFNQVTIFALLGEEL
jgi:SOS response regulatory protein OraA/RecX